MKVIFPVVIVIMLISAQSLFSQTDTIKTLVEVQVTSFRSAIDLATTPGSIHKLNNTAVRAGRARTTPEWLEQVPGTLVQKTNHGGGSVFIRGLTGNQTLLLLDGFRLNNAIYRYGPNQYLNTIDPYLLGHAEILKGSGSVQYGSDAIGGTIHLMSKDLQFAEANKGWHSQLLGKWVSGGMEYTGRPEVQFRNNTLAFSAGATIRKFGDLLGGQGTGFQRPSGYSENSWDAKMAIRTGNGSSLTLAHQFTGQSDVPVYHKIVLENFSINHMTKQSRMMNYAKWEKRLDSKVAEKITIGLCHQESVEHRSLQKNGSTSLRKEADQVTTLGSYAQVNLKFFNAWSSVAGIEYYRDKVNSTRTDQKLNTSELPVNLRGLYPDKSHFNQFSVYNLHRLNWHNWILEAGLRWNGYSIDISDTTLGEVVLNPSALVWNASAGKNFLKHHFVYVSTNSGFRAPNVDDLGTLGIVDFRFETPNKNLTPEYSRYFETGYKFNSGKVNASAAFWYMHLTDLIIRKQIPGQTRNGYPLYQKENAGSAFLYGLDAAINWTPNPQWLFKAWYHYTYGQDVTNNDPLRRVPPKMWNFNTEYNVGQWRMGIIYQGASKQDRLAKGDIADNRIPKGGTLGWNVFHAYVGLEWKILDVQLGAINVFNENYRTHGSGIQGQGRSIFVNFKIGL